jgi:hypothetical protein
VPVYQHFEANRVALQLREELVPYIYTAHRAAFLPPYLRVLARRTAEGQSTGAIVLVD